MIRVSVIGSGNVAQHLIRALLKAADTELVQVFSRNPEAIRPLMVTDKTVSEYRLLKAVDVIIIAVSDNAIKMVSEQIPLKDQLVVHTSGSVAMEALQKNRSGVFYPLQTFSKTKALSFESVPICLETRHAEDMTILENLAKSLSAAIYRVDSNQRRGLHVAAVFVSNFVNHMYQLGYDICNDNNLPFDILKPLIQETADKVMLLSPEEAQTGPARRNDTQTINAHLSFLTVENQREIYKLLTKSIIDNGKKL